MGLERMKNCTKKWNECRCICHKFPGVKHCVPCCSKTYELTEEAAELFKTAPKQDVIDAYNTYMNENLDDEEFKDESD